MAITNQECVGKALEFLKDGLALFIEQAHPGIRQQAFIRNHAAGVAAQPNPASTSGSN